MNLKGDTGRGIYESRKHEGGQQTIRSRGRGVEKLLPALERPTSGTGRQSLSTVQGPQLILLCYISPPSKVIHWGCLSYGLRGLGVQFSSFKSYVNKWKYQSKVSGSLFPFKAKGGRCKDVKRKIKEKCLTQTYSSLCFRDSVRQPFNKFIKLKIF